ncbi:A/G-specific adenine glycosylase [Legionella longbeachae]|uniref:Adenine DNA glycosylase n=1 Tax=Legionella longbeachae serogroup 1 (strain NSW150) TaxID=661367 RepID=D3HQM0_LEGLN|nr:A/G-specific adenine glycosylase [Legionella longbeachae]VEE01706.1 A/G-specific adenine glycosylase [Legionella oakridgensis]ARB91959.1 A/G-specific adenine glycosylase [Legionella longbeachae]ARM34856.1 A/G-specific adenine glycosylase [Legionella longbeachae]QIN34975.1 A/G-specific adenine glycosylase [Legionella longbeachae]RZV26938.1 A/G-specific adenine glycosylase [Legionella longbeachae]
MKKQKLHEQFSKPLLLWFDLHGRKNLPWQHPRTPYRVWVSEIMLQQTQVQTVIPYFERFMQRFPNISDLAHAQEDDVLSLWSGLGYYSRARNLHQTAKLILQHHQGIFPNDSKLLNELPGIGPSTSAAILSQAFNKPAAILDGNVKRVLTRFFRITGYPEQSQVKKKLWELADLCMPQENCADYTQAIMDLGATCCITKNPHCSSCPLHINCLAFKHKEQHLFPTKKIKKSIPIQYQQLLVLHNEQGYIYLEKRPSPGLWGGLWCLPNISTDKCPLDFIRVNYDLSGEHPQPLLAFKHRFSHFHLEINALSIKTTFFGRQLSENQGQWFAKEQLNSLGLAQPTRKILSYHYDTSLNL